MGDDAAWGLPEQLLATVADGIALRVWQDSRKRSLPKPKPIPRPGVKGYQAAKRRRSTLSPEEKGARILDLMERRRRELEAEEQGEVTGERD